MKRLLQTVVVLTALVLLPILAGTETIEGLAVLLFFCALMVVLFVATLQMPQKKKVLQIVSAKKGAPVSLLKQGCTKIPS